jgi:hypothetical protein
MATCNPVTVLQDSDCLLCLSEKQLQVAILTLLCQVLQQFDPMATCNVEDLISDSSPYLAMNNKQLLAAQLEKLCELELLFSGGAGGLVHTDTVDPVADPGVPSQLWINRTSGQVWYWNDTTGAWVLLIA